ncbi:MAG: DNA-processing protein DprA [Alphaproteobacteria bacterium]
MNAPTGKSLGEAERIDWLRLTRTEGIGPVTFMSLLARFASAGEALRALPELSRRGGARHAPRIPSRSEAEAEIAGVRRLGGRILCLCEPDYPEPLAAITDPPPVITVLGDARLLRRPMIGIVGARNASANGRKLARMIAAELSEAGLIVVSGMARGIDAAAHEACPNAVTVGVVAGGADVVYPRENQALHDRIVLGGAVVTEMPLGTEPQARHFPRRNRIVAGLSRGVLVVEAALRSGSLITARMALEQGREVFAVPGSPLDQRCQGTNNLIRQGAVLTESARDILDTLIGVLDPPTLRPRVPAQAQLFAADSPGPLPSEADLDPARMRILGLLSPSPIPVDELIRECQVSVPDANAVLLELELAGRISRTPGNLVALVAAEA